MTQTGKWWVNSRLIAAGVASIVFLVVALIQAADLYWLGQRGEVVTGTVASEHHSRHQDWIKVNYRTKADQLVTDKTSNYHHAVVGQTIEVRYDRENPHRMQAADYTLDYTYPLAVYGGASAVLLLAAVGQAYFKRRRQSGGPTPVEYTYGP